MNNIIQIIAKKRRYNLTPVIRLWGQSNANGMGEADELPANLQGEQSDMNIQTRLLTDFAKYNAGVNSDGRLAGTFSVECWIMNYLTSKNFPQVYTIKYAQGGRRLALGTGEEFHPDGDVLYAACQTLTDDALSQIYNLSTLPVIIADIWLQGWSDALVDTYSNDYETNQRALISRSRADITTLYSSYGLTANNAAFLSFYGLDEIPFIDVKMSANSGADVTRMNTINAGKTAIYNDTTVKNTYLIDTDDCSFVDNAHYDHDGIKLIGNKINNILKTLYNF